VLKQYLYGWYSPSKDQWYTPSQADAIIAAAEASGVQLNSLVDALQAVRTLPKSAVRDVLASFGLPLSMLSTGGFTLSEGLAYLHAHEYVIPAAKTMDLAAATGVGGNIIIRNYTILDGKVAAESVNRVNASRENRATGGPGGRRWSRSG